MCAATARLSSEQPAEPEPAQHGPAIIAGLERRGRPSPPPLQRSGGLTKALAYPSGRQPGRRKMRTGKNRGFLLERQASRDTGDRESDSRGGSTLGAVGRFVLNPICLYPISKSSFLYYTEGSRPSSRKNLNAKSYELSIAWPLVSTYHQKVYLHQKEGVRNGCMYVHLLSLGPFPCRLTCLFEGVHMVA